MIDTNLFFYYRLILLEDILHSVFHWDICVECNLLRMNEQHRFRIENLFSGLY